MRKIVILLLLLGCFIAQSQNFNYDKEWKSIEDRIEKKGDYKSVIPQIEAFNLRAKKEGNTQQFLRSLQLLQVIVFQTEEHDEFRDMASQLLTQFLEEEAQAKGIEKLWLQYYNAENLTNYWLSNRYSYNIEDEINSVEEDTLSANGLEGWSTQRFQEEIEERYETLFQAQKTLINEKLTDWPALFIEYENTELTPTLYHYFMNSYLGYLENNTMDYTDDVNLNHQKKIRTLYNTFSTINRKHRWYDSYAFFKSQEIEAQAERAKVNEDLLELVQEKEIQSSDYKTQIIYHIANLYIRKNEKRKAYELCLSGFQEAKSTNKWRNNLENLKIQLEKKDASLNFPFVLHPSNKIPIEVSHYQTESLYYRVYAINSVPNKPFEEKDSLDQNLNWHFNAPIVREGKIPIQSFDDFNTHNSIVVWDPFPNGEYRYVISNQQNFQIQDTLQDFIKKNDFLVSPYTIASRVKKYRENNDNYIVDYQIQLMDSNTGKPLANTSIGLYDYYDDLEKIQETRTDENGEFSFRYNDNKSFSDSEDIALSIPGESSILPLEYFNIRSYYPYEEREKNWNPSAKILMDRSIYRPGQTVYFKSILYKTLKDEKQLITSEKVKIILKDVNYQEVAQQELTTNNYGSVAGTFQLPNNGTLGSYQIIVHYKNEEIGRQYISVEEYKRPKFEVNFEEVKENFSLSDSIQVKGKAVSFAGSNLTDADVSYSVTRQDIYPFPMYKGGRCIMPPYRYSQPEMITYGETTTKSDGSFEVTFFPKQPTVSDFEKGYPKTYAYTISVEVTDINGETHSSETTVKVGEIPKQLYIQAPNSVLASELQTIQINSYNLNNQKVAAEGSYEIIKLIDPQQEVITKKFDYHPNYESLSKEALQQLFPHFSFENLPNINEFELGETVYSRNFRNEEFTEGSEDWGRYTIPKLEKGHYVINAQEMYGKDTIRAFQYVEVLDEVTHSSNDHEFLVYFFEKNEYSIGETAKLKMHTDLPGGIVYYTIQYEGSKSKMQAQEYKDGNLTIEIPIVQEMKNGTYIQFHFAKDQGMEHYSVAVPIRNEIPPLEITTKVFRDKLQPGQAEKWQIHISGKDKEKINAELLATMYDASLDQIKPHNVNLYFPVYRYSFSYRDSYQFSTNNPKISNWVYYFNANRFPFNYEGLSSLYNVLSFNYRGGTDFNYYRGNVYDDYMGQGLQSIELASDAMTEGRLVYKGVPGATDKISYSLQGAVSGIEIANDYSNEKQRDADGIIDLYETPIEEAQTNGFGEVQIRKNLQETAFFFPQLRTDEKGDVILEFTSPEALTTWKLMLLAHTQDLRTAQKNLYTQTQKELMVIPNPPRYLREGDQFTFSTKIANISSQNLQGDCTLQIFDALTMNPIDDRFDNAHNIQSFSVASGENTAASWQLKIPKDIPAIVYRVIAKTNTFSDGEENSLPILSNRILVTETQPISIREGQHKTYEFEALKNNTSSTLLNHQLTLSLNTNPTWMAIFALPYLMEFPYECSEQLFNRYYSNALAKNILAQQPNLQKVLDIYGQKDISTSKLWQNETLKNIALEETPWLKDALSQEEQLKMLATHFQSGTLEENLQKAENTFWKNQNSSGGFSWFNRGNDSPYISQYVLAGLGKLKNVGIMDNHQLPQIQQLIQYCDNEMWNEIQKGKNAKKPYVPYAFNYLYARSFWLEEFLLPENITQELEGLIETATVDYSSSELQKQAQFAIVLQRLGKKEKARQMLSHLEETSVESETNGMYWKANQVGFSWYEKPIETQAMIIEAFQEIAPEKVEKIEAMKVWLIGQKQNQHWATSKSTSDAIYALLNAGKSWNDSAQGVQIQSQFSIPDDELTKSGRIEAIIPEQEITPQSSKVEISKTSPGVAMGGLYWQYFENLEAIPASENGLKLQKELFLKKKNDQGDVLQKITENSPITVGDKVVVRITLATDRDIEFVHLKDMRASGFEPGNPPSRYYYENGMRYYLNSRDAATHFFFDYLEKGTHVLEYEVTANNEGTFSNGISTLQSMYAPELSAHSNGIKVIIKNQ